MKYNFLKVQNLKKIDEVENLINRANNIDLFSDVAVRVLKILSDVKRNKSSSLLKFCKDFDNFYAKNVSNLKVTEDEFNQARKNVTENYPEFVKAISVAADNIKEYHTQQLKNESKSWFVSDQLGNKKLGQKIIPIKRIGVYVPGGRFLYPSSVLMNIIPARVAGVKEIIAASPPQENGKISDFILFVFSLLNIKDVYKIGGAHAIAAMAFGVEEIKKVDKIIGPGNIYVTIAKKLVYGDVGIDSLAGPSEILIIADKSADPEFIAADILSQAEHDPNALSLLLTNDEKIAKFSIEKVYEQIDNFFANNINTKNTDIESKKSKHLNILIETLKNNCKIFYNQDLNFLIEASNIIAPEHLEIMTENFESVLEKINNAGAVFLGKYSPVAIGDYICGTNHIIPTAGNAKFSSPLGVYDFLKKTSIAYYSKDYLKKEAEFIEILAEFENLIAHKKSISIRIKDE